MEEVLPGIGIGYDADLMADRQVPMKLLGLPEPESVALNIPVIRTLHDLIHPDSGRSFYSLPVPDDTVEPGHESAHGV